MRRLLVILFLCAGPFLRGQAPSDSLRLEKLDSALVYYTSMMEAESVDVKNEECDFLVNSVKDEETARHIALWLFDHYRNSALMGDEAVAVHVFDSYFDKGPFKMRSDYDEMDAGIFVSFNRSTLLGMKAPVVCLTNPCGRKVEIPRDGGMSVLFFYDTSCNKCKLEARLLPAVMKTVDFPLTFYAVYCGDDKRSWKDFRRHFHLRNRKVETVHLWDPDMETEYLRLYGVISTPRIYVTDKDGTVLGRRLEVESLQEILNYIKEGYAQKKN